MISHKNEVVRIAERERTQQDTFDQRESGRGRANAESQREHYCEGEGRRFPQLPKCKAEVLSERVHVSSITMDCAPNSYRNATKKSSLHSPRGQETRASSRILRFVALKPPHKFIVRIALYRDVADQFSNKVLSIKSALANALVDPDFADCGFCVFRCQDSTHSPIFGSRKFQNGDFVALFPFAILFLAHITNLPSNHACTLKETGGVRSARRAIWRETLRLRVSPILH